MKPIPSLVNKDNKTRNINWKRTVIVSRKEIWPFLSSGFI